jgi:hypothetical protein
MDFRNDGSFVQSTAVTVNLRYSVSGDQLTVSESPDGQPSPKTAVRFHVDGSSLTRQASDGSTTKAERLGKPEKVLLNSSGSGGIVTIQAALRLSALLPTQSFAKSGKRQACTSLPSAFSACTAGRPLWSRIRTATVPHT